jgi:hypothetical protein
VLGIFGREGRDIATLWGPPAADQPSAFPLRIYINAARGTSVAPSLRELPWSRGTARSYYVPQALAEPMQGGFGAW